MNRSSKFVRYTFLGFYDELKLRLTNKERYSETKIKINQELSIFNCDDLGQAFHHLRNPKLLALFQLKPSRSQSRLLFRYLKTRNREWMLEKQFLKMFISNNCNQWNLLYRCQFLIIFSTPCWMQFQCFHYYFNSDLEMWFNLRRYKYENVSILHSLNLFLLMTL